MKYNRAYRNLAAIIVGACVLSPSHSQSQPTPLPNGPSQTPNPSPRRWELRVLTPASPCPGPFVVTSMMPATDPARGVVNVYVYVDGVGGNRWFLANAFHGEFFLPGGTNIVTRADWGGDVLVSGYIP